MGTEENGWAAAALSELFAGLHAMVHRGDDRFTVLGSGLDAVDPLTRLAEATQHSAWNLQRMVRFGGLREADELNELMIARGVSMRTMVPPVVVHRYCPLLTSYDPAVRLAPVPHPLIVADGRTVVVGNVGGDVLHTTSDPVVVAEVVRTVDRVWHASPLAVPAGTQPPFTRRMVDVAFLLVEGATDASIAKALGVSQRTVSADVSEMTRRLGARSRAHAIALISGNG